MAITKISFKAVLMDVEGIDRPQQLFANNQHDCEAWGKDILNKLTDKQRATGYVRVYEMKEVPLVDVHPAKIPGEFAVARYYHKETAA